MSILVKVKFDVHVKMIFVANVAHLSFFKILQINSLFNQGALENSTTNIEWNAMKTTISYAWEVEG